MMMSDVEGLGPNIKLTSTKELRDLVCEWSSEKGPGAFWLAWVLVTIRPCGGNAAVEALTEFLTWEVEYIQV